MLLCLLAWQILGSTHFHTSGTDSQLCETCMLIAGSPTLDAPPKIPLFLIPVVLFFVYLLAVGTQNFFSTQHFKRTPPSHAPPAL